MPRQNKSALLIERHAKQLKSQENLKELLRVPGTTEFSVLGLLGIIIRN
jgi:hypothetical protein